MTEFIEWKKTKGYDVRTLLTSQINSNGAPTCDEITTAIRNFSPYPTYLLIIGDHNQESGVQACQMHKYDDEKSTDNRPTDLPFACKTETDNIPDLLYGRLPAGDVTELNTMLQKVMYMDKTPPSQSIQYDRIVVAASNVSNKTYLETADAVHTYFSHNHGSYNYQTWSPWIGGPAATDPWPVTNGNSLLWKGAGATPVGTRVADKFLGMGWQSTIDLISAKVNEGVAILFHRDHGQSDGFVEPAFRNTQLDALTNSDKLPLILSINCSTGEYQQGATNSFGRKWLNKTNGGGTCGGGAYAFVGATSPTDPCANEFFAHGLFMAFIPGWQEWFNTDDKGYHDEVNWYSNLFSFFDNSSYLGLTPGNATKLGAMVHFAKMYTFQAFQDNKQYIETAERYHLLGDPEADVVFHAPGGKVTPVVGSDITPIVNYMLGEDDCDIFASDIFDFENSSYWTLSSGCSSLNTTIKTHGNASLQISGGGYQTITSSDISTSTITGSTSGLTIDVYLGPTQPNIYWIGQVQLLVSCPSAGLYNVYIGQNELTNLTLSAFHTLSFTLPSNVLAALNGNYSDFSFMWVLNTNANSGPYYLDNMKFAN